MSTTTFVYLSETADQADDSTITLTESDGTTPVASDVAFPLTNLKTSDITELWQSTNMDGHESGGNPVLAQRLNIDRGVTTNWDLVCLVNHNFAQTVTRFALYSGTTNVLGSMTSRGDFTWRSGDMYIRLSTPTTHRYLVIQFANIAVWTPSMGRLLIGSSTVSALQLKYGWTISPETKQSVNISAFNVKHVDTFCQYKQLSLPVVIGSKASAATLMTFLESLQGMRYWFFLIPWIDEYDGYVVRQMSKPVRTRDFNEEINTVEVEEESRGVRIGA